MASLPPFTMAPVMVEVVVVEEEEEAESGAKPV